MNSKNLRKLEGTLDYVTKTINAFQAPHARTRTQYDPLVRYLSAVEKLTEISMDVARGTLPGKWRIVPTALHNALRDAYERRVAA